MGPLRFTDYWQCRADRPFPRFRTWCCSQFEKPLHFVLPRSIWQRRSDIMQMSHNCCNLIVSLFMFRKMDGVESMKIKPGPVNVVWPRWQTMTQKWLTKQVIYIFTNPWGNTFPTEKLTWKNMVYNPTNHSVVFQLVKFWLLLQFSKLRTFLRTYLCLACYYENSRRISITEGHSILWRMQSSIFLRLNQILNSLSDIISAWRIYC